MAAKSELRGSGGESPSTMELIQISRGSDSSGEEEDEVDGGHGFLKPSDNGLKVCPQTRRWINMLITSLDE